jgi:arginase family enzyme
MIVAHIIGKGAPELVRFWGEPPLVREPDVTLFGLQRIDPPEQEFLDKSPMRRVSAEVVQAKGAGDAARSTLMQMHADARQVILHLDTDVITQEEFPAVNVPGSGGLGFADVREALMEFVKNPNLLGLDVAQYNPDKDSDGSGAKKLVDLLVDALTARLQAIPESETTTTGTGAATSGASPVPATHEQTSPVSQASDEPTQANRSSNAPNSEEESSSDMSAHETSA